MTPQPYPRPYVRNALPVLVATAPSPYTTKPVLRYAPAPGPQAPWTNGVGMPKKAGQRNAGTTG